LGTGVFFVGVNWQWHEADHTPSFSAEVLLHVSLTAVTHVPYCMFKDIFFVPGTRLVATDLVTLFN
jgi:hypothetical protein